MLQTPKNFKHKKVQKGKRHNTVTKNFTIKRLYPGFIALKAVESGKLNANQIAAMRQTINKIIKKKGTLKINVFPHIPITKKPIEVRMGKGKGNVNRWISKIKSGTLLCEIEIMSSLIGKKALKLAQVRLPIKTKIIIN